MMMKIKRTKERLGKIAKIEKNEDKKEEILKINQKINNQKIKNRISAQISRQNKINQFKLIEEKNLVLLNENEKLKIKVKYLTEENRNLKNKLKIVEYNDESEIISNNIISNQNNGNYSNGIKNGFNKLGISIYGTLGIIMIINIIYNNFEISNLNNNKSIMKKLNLFEENLFIEKKSSSG